MFRSTTTSKAILSEKKNVNNNNERRSPLAAASPSAERSFLGMPVLSNECRVSRDTISCNARIHVNNLSLLRLITGVIAKCLI